MINEIDPEFQKQHELTGTIQSSLKPTRQDLRGITLYANGRLINEQGFFDVPEAGHAFSYLSGWIDADYIDEFSEDFIATDRHSLSWDLEEPQKLKKVLQRLIRKIVNEWSTMRTEENKKKVNAVVAKSDINLEQWKSTLDSNIVTPLEKVINDLAKNEVENIDEEDSTFKKTIDSLHKLVPEYAQFHFRYMHPILQDKCKEYYQNANYYIAVQQACIAYSFAVKDKIEEFGENRPTGSERNIMARYFGQDKLIRVALNSTKTNGQPLEMDTKKGLEDAQSLLSQGVMAGFRNPIAHEGDNLKDGIISEKHCLDALSLISMLFERLENAEKLSET